jgi:chaperonin cofactor prefoldin
MESQMSDPKDMILPMLREIHEEMRSSFNKVDARFERLEQRFDNLREAVNGESVLGRYAAAEVEDRLEKIEKRLETLENRR